MPQRPKERVRRAILAAARRQLVAHGVSGATLGAIAAEAGTSVGNVYKYFPSKGALFAAAVPDPLVDELRDLLRRRIESLGTVRDVGELPGRHPWREASAQLLELATEHRHELLLLLRGAPGTRHEGFPDELARDLARLATRYASRAHPRFDATARRRRGLVRIYRGFIASIASILAEERSAAGLRGATEELVTYHLAGLRAFFASDDPAVPPTRSRTR